MAFDKHAMVSRDRTVETSTVQQPGPIGKSVIAKALKASERSMEESFMIPKHAASRVGEMLEERWTVSISMPPQPRDPET
jgi:hypothetical protein